MNAAQLRSISDQIRSAIQRSSRTRRDICESAGVNETSLSKFMSGERGLSLDAIESLAKEMNLQLVERKR